MNIDEKNELLRWIDVVNGANGYAGIFRYENAEDKQIIELSTAREFCTSLAEMYKLVELQVALNPHDPPDCFVRNGERSFSLELVQMVEGGQKVRIDYGERPYCNPLFSEMQWDKPRLSDRLSEIIKSKGNKYRERNILIDILLIYTGEPWLSSCQVDQWIQNIAVEKHPNIGAVFFLLEYEPGRDSNNWPLFHIYGDNLVEMGK